MTDGDIDVDGKILEQVGPGGSRSRVISLELVSLHGNINISAHAQIGDLQFPSGPAEHRTGASGPYVRGSAGINGGNIGLIGKNISVAGPIIGFPGSSGQAAYDVPPPIPPGGEPLPAATAVAVGGDGGVGGDVYLCAWDSIRVTPTGNIYGSFGGFGGSAYALPSVFGDAHAEAGSAGPNGDVILTGPPSLSKYSDYPKIFLEPGGKIAANTAVADLDPELALRLGGGQAKPVGGFATAESIKDDGYKAGTDAEAQGGAGSDGGTVELRGDVDYGFVPVIGRGGSGGDANAKGSRGSDGKDAGSRFGVTEGLRGGSAFALGGNGGKSASATDPMHAQGPGVGGNAEAISGAGGNGGKVLGGGVPVSCAPGARSGSSDAVGGAPQDVEPTRDLNDGNEPKWIVVGGVRRPCDGGDSTTSKAHGK